MIRSMRRIFAIYRRHRGWLLLCQLLVLISAITTIVFASLNAKLANEGVTGW